MWERTHSTPDLSTYSMNKYLINFDSNPSRCPNKLRRASKRPHRNRNEFDSIIDLALKKLISKMHLPFTN